jgi:hypothetical protein
MSRYCEPGRHTVPDHEAEILRTTDTGSGPGVPVYACHTCVQDGGLVPAAAFVGRRNLPPVTAREPS